MCFVIIIMKQRLRNLSLLLYYRIFFALILYLVIFCGYSRCFSWYEIKLFYLHLIMVLLLLLRFALSRHHFYQALLLFLLYSLSANRQQNRHNRRQYTHSQKLLIHLNSLQVQLGKSFRSGAFDLLDHLTPMPFIALDQQLEF